MNNAEIKDLSFGSRFFSYQVHLSGNSILHFNRKWSGAVHILCPFPRKLFLKLCMQLRQHVNHPYVIKNYVKK